VKAYPYFPLILLAAWVLAHGAAPNPVCAQEDVELPAGAVTDEALSTAEPVESPVEPSPDTSGEIEGESGDSQEEQLEEAAPAEAADIEPVIPPLSLDGPWHVPAGYGSLEQPQARLVTAPEEPPHWASSYWVGLGGMALGVGVGALILLGALAVAFSGSSDGGVGAVVLGLTAPLVVVTGTATGVFLHGRARGGHGSFGAAFGGSLLGGVISLASFALAGVGGEGGVAGVGPLTAVVAMPLLGSWAYWKNSRSNQPQGPEGSSAAVVPVLHFSEHSAYFGAAGAF
jgi:hypothetical protein